MPTRVEKKEKKSRIVEIDFIRGVLIWLVAVDHLFFDFMQIVPNFFSPYQYGNLLYKKVHFLHQGVQQNR